MTKVVLKKYWVNYTVQIERAVYVMAEDAAAARQIVLDGGADEDVDSESEDGHREVIDVEEDEA